MAFLVGDAEASPRGNTGDDIIRGEAFTGGRTRNAVIKKRNTMGVEDVALGEGFPPRIILPLMGRSTDQLQQEISSIPPDLCKCIDLFEWRVDRLTDMENQWEEARDLVSCQSPVPVIATVRTVEEGGYATLSHHTYAAIVEGLSERADAVDIQIASPHSQELIEVAHQQGCVVIGSIHDCEGTPPSNDIVTVAQQMEDKGVDIAKAAYTCHQPSDVLPVLTAQVWCRQNLSIPSLIIGIGHAGSVTRVVGPLLGAAASFTSMDPQNALGQLSISDTHTIVDILRKNT